MASPRTLDDWLAAVAENAAKAREVFEAPLPLRPPGLCTGCPERPVFSAMKILRKEIGPTHVAADIGCHALATFAPFDQGNSILGYGMSLASAAAVANTQERKPISVMGDGGFWHNGLLTGVAGSVFNRNDGVLVIMNNGYSSATGAQDLPSSAPTDDGRGRGVDIEKTLRGMGVQSVERVRTYDVAKVAKTLKTAISTPSKGLRSSSPMANASSRGNAASGPRTRRRLRRASAWCAPVSGSIRKSAPAIIRASGSPAARP